MTGALFARLWREHRPLVIGFACALLVTIALGGRMIYATVYWSQHREMALAPWMTLGFVAHSWDVDRLRLVAALGLDPDTRARLTLEEIAARTGRGLPEVIAILETEIAAERAAERGP